METISTNFSSNIHETNRYFNSLTFLYVSKHAMTCSLLYLGSLAAVVI